MTPTPAAMGALMALLERTPALETALGSGQEKAGRAFKVAYGVNPIDHLKEFGEFHLTFFEYLSRDVPEFFKSAAP